MVYIYYKVKTLPIDKVGVLEYIPVDISGNKIWGQLVHNLGNLEVLIRIPMPSIYLKGTNTWHSGHMGQNIWQTDLMVEINSKSLVRAVDKILLMKFS